MSREDWGKVQSEKGHKKIKLGEKNEGLYEGL